MDIVSAKRIYCIGIKGTGMTSLAQILSGMGKDVSGSDVADVYFTDAVLERADIPFAVFDAKRIKKTEIDLIVASAAYGPDHEEVAVAIKKGIPILYYPEALGQLVSSQYGIGIVGTHGKTNTTALMGTVMQQAQYKPSVVVGTEVASFGGNCLVGSGEFMIAELCEYRRHFLSSTPKAVICTGIEMDHPDYFKDVDDVYAAFGELFGQMNSDGIIVYAKSNAMDIFMEQFQDSRRVISYGIAKGDFVIDNIVVAEGKQSFDVSMRGQFIDTFTLQVPGRHQVLNACGVIALSMELGVPLQKIKEGLLSFGGLKRRTEIMGESDGVLYIDDYGHHPTEIKTTLAGLKEFYPHRRLVCVFQSHTYSRTAELLKEFGHAFGHADKVYVNDIFASAREAARDDDLSERLVYEIKSHHGDVTHTPKYVDTVFAYEKEKQAGDLFVCMGAGDAYKVAKMLLDA